MSALGRIWRRTADRIPAAISRPAAIGLAIGGSAVLITVLFLSLSRIEAALPRFGFFSIREFHIAIRDVTHLRDMVSLARLAPGDPLSREKLAAANDIVYIRFVRVDGPDTVRALPEYASIVPLVTDIVSRIDAILAQGFPFDSGALSKVTADLDHVVDRMNDEYYKYGEQVNFDLYSAEIDLQRFNYLITLTLGLLSALAIGTATLLISRRETIAKLAFLAWRDPTTDLKNRAWMSENIGGLLLRAGAARQQVRLFLIDLDHFKGVNDTFGHHVGDLLLKSVAEVLASFEQQGEAHAIRLGGDEFALVAIGESGLPDGGFGEFLLDRLNGFVDLEGHRVRRGASIGMASFPGHAADTEALMRHADLALYAAKGEGRSAYVAFSASMLRGQNERETHEAAILRSLARDEFVLVWQPQFEVATGRIVGAEALVRRRDLDTNELLAPSTFIPIAEKSDLIAEIDKVVLRKACAFAANRLDLVPDDFVFAVNISGRSLLRGNFRDYLMETLQRSGLPPRHLQLEITEGVFVNDSRAALDMLGQIRKNGVSVALDDFGVGYSSFGSLADLDLSHLKIDRTFLQNLLQSQRKQDVVCGILALAGRLGLKVVAEGVETEEQMAFLREQNCHIAQGFLLSRPLDAELFGALLASRKPGIGAVPVLQPTLVSMAVGRKAIG